MLPLFRRCLLVCLWFSPLASAGEAMDRLNAFFAASGGMRADFVQTVQGSAFAQPERSSGSLMMLRPGRFRWDYREPYAQQIVADGERLWVYDADLEQVVVKPMDEALGDTPALLLSGDATAPQRFVIHELPEPRDGLRWVQLLPRQKDTGFEELRLGFDARSLRRMELVDGFGQLTRLDFSNVQENVTLPADAFRFVPPKGVDVIGGDS